MKRAKSKSNDHSKKNSLKANGGLPPVARKAVRAKHVSSTVQEVAPAAKGKAKGFSRSRTAEIAQAPVATRKAA